MESWISKQKVYKGKIFTVTAGQARLDDDTLVQRDVVEHGGGVAVVPVLGDTVVLIRQFRIAVGRELLELPAGRLEGDEFPAARAQLELEEEIGYHAGRLIPALSYYSSPGFTNERMHIFLAFDLEKTTQRLEFDERVEKMVLSLTEVRHLLATREIEDAKTIIGLRELLAHLG